MRKFLAPVLFALMLCASSVFAGDIEYIEREVIVVIDDSYASSAMGAYASNTYVEALNLMAESFAGSVGLVSLGTFPDISSISGSNIVHLKSETKNTEQLIRELENNPDVKSVQPNYIRRPFGVPKTFVSEGATADNSQNDLSPNDPHYEEQWGMVNIGMPQVWEHYTGGENICVAVIDSGIDYNHPDLNANMAMDSLGNYGRLFKNGAQSDNPMDIYGHGTHVAGIIGAIGNNGIGVTGVNWKVKMLAVNVMQNGIASDTDLIKGINYVVSEKKAGLNIRVANMSLGGWDYPLPDSSPVGIAIKSMSDAGILCIMAVSNDSQNISNPTGNHSGKLVYPACFKFANTISVGSIGPENNKSSYSDYGSVWVNIAAPGEKIYSTLPNNRYGTMGGTSMSAPHVTGAAALLFSAFPDESTAKIKERILKGARTVESNKGYWESGLLDVARAYGIESDSELDEPLTSVEIAGENSIFSGEFYTLSNIKFPSNANGYFEYLWESSNESVIVINGKNNPAAEIKGLSNGSATITLAVTQTLQNETKITKSNSIDVSVTGKPSSGSSSSGCNLGLILFPLLMALPAFKSKK
jgi:subtilisin family serine protease